MKFFLRECGSLVAIPKALVTCLLLGCTAALPASDGTGDHATGADHFWPAWRGPLSTGVAPHAVPPVNWSESTNVRWRIELPGAGHSSPIVWGDRIFLTAAVPDGDAQEPVVNYAPGAHDNLPVTHNHRFVVLAVNRKDGAILWKRTVRRTFPHEGGHTTGSLASNSPITDGTHVYAFFGSRGLYCLDFDGNIKWEKSFGEMQTRHAHGEGSSPALHGDTLIVNWDHQGSSFMAALDKKTGEERWKVDRDEITSWSTPLIVEHNGSVQVIASATRRIRSYDLSTGELIWECAGLSRNVVATPVSADGIVYAGNSYDHQAMLAIRLEGAKGDITGTDQIVWTLNRLTPYVPSPLLYDGTLYFLRHNQGVLSAIHAKTGRPRYDPIRLPGLRQAFASPVAADGRIYFADRSGITLVVSHEDEPELLAANPLDDIFSASPALVENELYLRGERYLYCIEAKPVRKSEPTAQPGVPGRP